jgi:hypothetical protein
MRAGLLGIVLVAGCAPPEPDPPEASPSVDPRVAALCARLENDPDLLHNDYTPAVHELISIGRPAIPPALDLMLADNEDTRMHAQRVLEGVTARELGFVFGEGWKRPDGASEWRRFWARLGGLSYKAPPDQRAASVGLWRAWLAEQP